MTPTSTTQTSNRPGRPRDDARRDAILAATQNLLTEVGYDRMTIESVASRCGAGKTTIYRRWPDKAALVADAVSVAALNNPAAIPNTGALRDDLILFAKQWHSPNGHRDGLIAGLLTAMRHHPELRAAVGDTITRPGQRAFRHMVHRAVQRGEIEDHHQVDLIGAILPAMVFHHITTLDKPVNRNLIVKVVDNLVLPALRGPSSGCN